MGTALHIRQYERRDRAAVRRICCDTADAGQPVERFFPDREIIADLLTNYYTEFEPQSIFVADAGAGPVGYLTGCLSTSHYLRVVMWRIAPLVFAKALVRGALWHPQTIRLLRANIGMWLTNGYRSSPALREYPAHLHVNVQEGFRGQHIGQRLVEAFCQRACDAGVRGVHAGVSADNSRACHFFEEQGFIEVHREPRMRKPDESRRILYTIIYARSLD
jgi:ribosomal protein S18 acetylase RimI-like enzyme